MSYPPSRSSRVRQPPHLLPCSPTTHLPQGQSHSPTPLSQHLMRKKDDINNNNNKKLMPKKGREVGFRDPEPGPDPSEEEEEEPRSKARPPRPGHSGQAQGRAAEGPGVRGQVQTTLRKFGSRAGRRRVPESPGPAQAPAQAWL